MDKELNNQMILNATRFYPRLYKTVSRTERSQKILLINSKKFPPPPLDYHQNQLIPQKERRKYRKGKGWCTASFEMLSPKINNCDIWNNLFSSHCIRVPPKIHRFKSKWERGRSNGDRKCSNVIRNHLVNPIYPLELGYSNGCDTEAVQGTYSSQRRHQ